MTFVSIKYARDLGGRLHPLEIGIDAHVRHGRHDFGERAPARPRQDLGKDGAVFSLGTLAVFTGALFESPDDGFIDSSNQQIGHKRLLGLN